jgi:hypothetical protein
MRLFVSKYLLIVCFFLLGKLCYSQSYGFAGGLRMGTEVGFSFVGRVENHTTLEGIFQSSVLQPNQLGTSLYVKQHFPLLTRRINFFMGFGGFYDFPAGSEPVNPKVIREPAIHGYGPGIMLGAELSIGKLNLSYDFRPQINLSGEGRAFVPNTALTMRYIFISGKDWFPEKKKKKKINWRFWEKR